MNKLAYFNLPDTQEEVAPPPPSAGDILKDFWRDSMSLLDFYCERNASGWWQEPINTWSNLLFLIAAFAGFTICRRREAHSEARNEAHSEARNEAHSEATSTAITQNKKKNKLQDKARLTLFRNLSAVGVASWAFHASGVAIFVMLDVLAITIFTMRVIFAWLIRGLSFSSRKAFAVVVAVFAFAPLLAFLPHVGDYVPNGGFYYSPILLSPILTLGVIAAFMLRNAEMRRYAMWLGISFALLAVSLTLRTLDLPLCAEWKRGTHFLWHTLNALAFFLVIVCLPNEAEPRQSSRKKLSQS